MRKRIGKVDRMGIPKKSAFWRPFSLGLAAASCLLMVGCPTNNNPREISSSEFIAPVLNADDSAPAVRVLTDKVTLLKQIFPETVNEELRQLQATARPLVKSSQDRLLVFEERQGALLGVDLCPSCSQSQFFTSSIDLHFSREGFEDYLENFGIVVQDPSLSFERTLDDTVDEPDDPNVRPIPLRGDTFSGWVLAFEDKSDSIVAFREDPDFRELPAGLLEPSRHPHFGNGNRLLGSVVITQQDMREVGIDEPAITRMFELEDGKLMVFFRSERSIGLIDLVMEPRLIDFDLTDGDQTPLFDRVLTDDQLEEILQMGVREVMVPRGRLRVFPADERGNVGQFISFDDIIRRTQRPTIKIDSFQPAFLPPADSNFCEDSTLPTGGSALIFDRVSSTFFRISENTDRTDLDNFGRGTISSVVLPEDLLSLVFESDDGSTGGPVDARELFMRAESYAPGCSPLVVFDQATKNLISLSTEFVGQERSFRLGLTADADGFQGRREPVVISGENDPVANEDTALHVAENGIRESRLYFDQGLDHLLSVHLATGNVVIVAKRSDFEDVTGEPLVNLTYIEALDSGSDSVELIRAFDSVSNSLVEIRLRYQALPVFDQERGTGI
ncbi:MAG: hypothetical protein AAF517_06925 [Planctomycetota bacterium]